MQVEWKVPASSPFFMVSSDGRVKVSDTGELAKIGDNGHGYKQVQIMRNAKRYTKYVHRLVAECFLENPNGFPEVNHLDGNKANNHVDNLEWCMRSQNQNHAIRTGLVPPNSEKQRKAASKTGKKTIYYARAGWEKWSKTAEAKEQWVKNLSKADRWGTRSEPSEVKAARRQERKRLYYQEHKEEISKKAHERYMKTRKDKESRKEGNYGQAV